MSSSDSENDLITYGTPLEPLEEDEIPKKRPCFNENQIATDKEGRRVFHGAFTGGFSAGFFNTVGTLEGWKPSTFKSSRSEKQQISKQKPEDFMDEEDFGEFGIAPRVLKAKKVYISDPQKQQNYVGHISIGTYVLKDLLKPVRETVGMKLLRKMGWKPGQGVGPRVTKNEKKSTLEIRKKVYGCMLPSDLQMENEVTDSNSDSEGTETKFAPLDLEPYLFSPKNNCFGIGYEGLDKTPILTSSLKDGDRFKEKCRIQKNYSQGFGVGALEEEDENIYEKDDMSRYDFFLDSKSFEKSEEKISCTPDGILDGFLLEVKKPNKKCYPKPTLPKNFIPHHQLRSLMLEQFKHLPKNKVSRWDKVSLGNEKKESENYRKESKIDVESREQEKLLTEKLITEVRINETRFKPFLSNDDKQKRYEKYLKLLKLGKEDYLKNLQPITMSKWDREREKMEFEKAAMLFKPLSGIMEERFLSASQPDDISDPLARVEKFCDENSSSKKKAAKMNMFGVLTRETSDWIPCSLLCKRFNIPDPQKSCVPTCDKKPAKYSLFDCLDKVQIPIEKLEKNALIVDDQEGLCVSNDISGSSDKNVNSVKPELKDSELEMSENKIDLFKAIFLASDDDDEEESYVTDFSEDKCERNECQESMYEDKVINLKRNDSPPSGLFENVDLDSLSTCRTNHDKSFENLEKNEEIESSKVSEENFLSSNLVYGPKIPESVPIRSSYFTTDLVTTDSDWVIKKVHHKKNKKKEKKKKKSSKSKHKHKRKDS